MNTASAAATVMSAASRATNFANQTVETARFEAIKEPLGFIKIIQFFMAILAFAIACNGSSSLAFTVQCQPVLANMTQTRSTVYQADYSYPYSLSSSSLNAVTNYCEAGKTTALDRNKITSDSTGSISASAQFFVFTGVMAFLYSLAFLIIYVIFKHKYDNIIYLPLVDFGCTALFALFWFAGSIAWAKAINDIQNYSNPENLISTLNVCKKVSCQSLNYPGYANVIISCILGFGNFILWAGDVWFVLKETSWYKTRKQLQQQQQQPAMNNNPISASNVNISAQYSANNNKI